MVRLAGKAILAAILIPMLVYLCLTIVMKEKAEYSWGLIFADGKFELLSVVFYGNYTGTIV